MDIREKLVELLREGIMFHYFLTCEEQADYLLANGVTVQEWIPVTERLPSDEKEVLVYYGFGDLRFMHMGILTYYCFDPNPHWQHEGTGMKITHWMPLPQPPKGADDQ